MKDFGKTFNQESQKEISRRLFFRVAGMAGIGLAASRGINLTWGEAPLNVSEFRGVELAIATICTDGFGNKHHKPAFELLPQLPYRNVEFNLWYPDVITPGYIQSIKERCEKTGLKAVCLQGSSFGGEGHAEIIKDISHKLTLMHACQQLGCRRIKCTGARRGTSGGLKAVIEVLKQLAPAAEDMGVLVLLENHANNVLETIQDYEEIFAAIDSPNVGMCLDTGHFEGVGISLIDVVNTFPHRILHVDLKDCRKFGAGHDTVVFGEGETDFDAFLNHLLSKGYHGYLVVDNGRTDGERNRTGISFDPVSIGTTVWDSQASEI